MLSENSIKLIWRVTFIIWHLIKDSNELLASDISADLTMRNHSLGRLFLPFYHFHVATGSRCLFHHSMSSYFIRVLLTKNQNLVSVTSRIRGWSKKSAHGKYSNSWVVLLIFRKRRSMITYWHSCLYRTIHFYMNVVMKPDVVSVPITHMPYFQCSGERFLR